MKKAYVKPVVEGQMFEANEYVASCYIVYGYGQGGKLYEITRLTKMPGERTDDGDDYYYRNHDWWMIKGKVDSPVGYSTYDPKDQLVDIREVKDRKHPNASA